jgi:hypothetical protein
VKRCTFDQVGLGVFSNYSGSSNFYIADSTLLGRNDSKHLIGWNGAFWQQFNGVEGQEFPPVMKSYTAIRLYGPGHVVADNYVADFHDGIDTEMWGPDICYSSNRMGCGDKLPGYRHSERPDFGGG